MKLVEFNIESNTVNVERNLLGVESVFVNNKLKSKKRTMFGSSHDLSIDGNDYTIKYTVKDVWKKWIGKPVVQLISGETVVSEHRIKNPMFNTIQFGLSFLLFYVVITLFFAFIESAKNGFVHYAH